MGAAGLDRFGAPDCILEETVDKWLRQHKGLLLAAPVTGGETTAAAGGGGREAASGSSSEEEDEEGGEWHQPCEVCGRNYPHQHIRSVYATRGSDNESDGEG